MVDDFITDEDLERFNKELHDNYIKYIKQNNIKPPINGYYRPSRDELDSYYEYIEYLVAHLECRRKGLEREINPTESIVFELSQEIYERNKVEYDRFYRDTMDGDKQYISWEYFDALLEIDSRRPQYEQEIKKIDEELKYKRKILKNHQKAMSISTGVKR